LHYFGGSSRPVNSGVGRFREAFGGECMVNTRDRAQVGLELIKEAILEELNAHPHGMTHGEIVQRLGLESDFEGQQRNYLSWSVLGILVGEGKVQYTGERQNKTYHLVSESSVSAGSN